MRRRNGTVVNMNSQANFIGICVGRKVMDCVFLLRNLISIDRIVYVIGSGKVRKMLEGRIRRCVVDRRRQIWVNTR